MNIRDYVEKQFQAIPDSTEKQNIMDELITNMSEKVDDMVEAGKDREDAINKVIVEFGEMDEITDSLKDKKVKKEVKLKAQLWFSVWGVIMISAMVIFSNYYLTPAFIWYPFAIFGVIWWPMSRLYAYTIRNKGE